MKRKSLMRHASVFCGSALALLFQGCISFATGPERSFTESGTKYQLSVKSVSRVNAKIERLQYSSGSPCYSLKLIADGNFVSHEGHSSMIGTPCMSFGLWPACADNENKKGDVFICSIKLFRTDSSSIMECRRSHRSSSSPFANTVKDRKSDMILRTMDS